MRASILALLAERPMHGYEMIQELQARTGGLWRPSAGSIYPTLQLLEDEGLVRSEQGDDRRRYSLTDAGDAEAARGERPPWERLAAEAEAPAARLRDAAFKLGAAIVQVARAGTDEQQARARTLLDETRRQLYAVLGESGGET